MSMMSFIDISFRSTYTLTLWIGVTQQFTDTHELLLMLAAISLVAKDVKRSQSISLSPYHPCKSPQLVNSDQILCI